MKRYLLFWIERFSLGGYNISDTNEMNIKPISDGRKMKYEHYINQPMKMVELPLTMIIAKNPQPTKSVDRFINHPSIKKIVMFLLVIMIISH